MAPVTFTQDGQTFICAWHPGHDVAHPMNVTGSHGVCPDCLARLLAEMRDARVVGR